MKTRAVCSIALTLALILTLCISATAAETTDQTPAYEVVVPLEFNQIYQVSDDHGLMVVERYGSYREPQRSLVTFGGEEVLTGTDILLCSDGILCRTRDWSGENPPTELYSFYDWSLTPVIPESPTRIVTTDSHNLLLMEVKGSSAHADLSYGERRLYDLEKGEIALECGYGSDGDEITLPNGQTVTPDRYGFSAFSAEVGKDPGHLQLRPFNASNPSVYSSNGQLLLDSCGTTSFICYCNDTVCKTVLPENGAADMVRYELLNPQGDKITATGPLADTSFSMISANHPGDCHCADGNDLVILRSGETNRSGVIRILKDACTFYPDVPADAWFCDAVHWAFIKNISAGTTVTAFSTGSTAVTFSPHDFCSRAQMVTFLWRAVGSPTPTSTVCPFTDVSADAYYYKAVLWAVENGITNGVSVTEFAPDQEVLRCQAITFLARMKGITDENDTNFRHGFTDVQLSDYFSNAVYWAWANNITTGTDATHFSPYHVCTRAQIVTFLYRTFGE